MTPSALDRDALQATISSEVILRGSPDYELARKPPIARFHDIRLQAVVLCSTPVGVDVERAYAAIGSTGALTFAAITALAIVPMLRGRTR
jgi:hypothetical protein